MEKKLSPKEWLIEERKKYGYDKLFSLNKKGIDEYISRLPKDSQVIARIIWYERYNKTFGKVWDEQTKDYLEHLKIGLNTNQIEIIDRIFIGVYPTGLFDGYVDEAPNGKKMIILNEGLLYTIHYWSNIFLRSLDEGNDDFFWKKESDRNSILKWIYSIWKCKPQHFLELPDCFPKTKDSWNLSQVLTYSAIVFVIGHELGHVICNHKYSSNTTYNYMMEYEADKVGLEICIRYSIIRGAFLKDTYFTKFMLFGPYLLMSIFALFKLEASKTHPSSNSRLEKIHNNYKKIMEDVLGEKLFQMTLRYLDDEIIERFENIGNKLFIRNLIYGEELKRKIENNWA